MRYTDCWNEVKDVRWLIYFVREKMRTREDFALKLGLMKFALNVANDVNKLSGKENGMYNHIEELVTANMVTGTEGVTIEGKHKRYLNKLKNEPLAVKDMFEFNTYFSLLTSDPLRAAENVYVNALKFIRNFAGGNEQFINDFKGKLADDFRDIIGEIIKDEDTFDLEAEAIIDMDKNSIYKEHVFIEVYFDGDDKDSFNHKGFHDMWAEEQNVMWIMYFLFSCGNVNEEKIRQFALNTLIDVVTKAGRKSLLELYNDDLKMVQDAIYGTVSREEVYANSYKDNVLPFMGFGMFRVNVYAAINALKDIKTEDAVTNAFMFIYRAIGFHGSDDKTFCKTVSEEISVNLKKEFSNPFDDFFHKAEMSYEGVLTLKKYGYMPVTNSGRWIFKGRL